MHSFHGTELQRYTRYLGHDLGHDNAVRQFQFNDRGVVSLSANSLHLSSRRGLCQWNLRLFFFFFLIKRSQCLIDLAIEMRK